MARLANSLVQLRAEIDALAPNRSKVSDGTIGDPAHRSRPSRHNPNFEDVICALDITDDPAGGCPIHAIAEQIRVHPHPDLAYIISNGHVAKRSTGFAWQTYKGSNPHTHHVHFAVGVGPDGDPRPPYDNAGAWGVAAAPSPAPVAAAGPLVRTLKKGAKGPDVKVLQVVLIRSGLLPAGSDDGVFGPKTHAATVQLQHSLGVTADGIVGPKTQAAMAHLLAGLTGQAA